MKTRYYEIHILLAANIEEDHGEGGRSCGHENTQGIAR